MIDCGLHVILPLVLLISNVLINAQGRACLSGFGVSVIRAEYEPEGASFLASTVDNAMRYRAPEIMAPMPLEGIDGYVPHLTLQCDVYSLGSVALHVSIRSCAFWGTAIQQEF
ncbi:hypothetical protein HWV62_26344 [Athelia sp. TMB]|nr:hypothetical protein HWV62_26344 [Athelia sp. TMB]